MSAPTGLYRQVGPADITAAVRSSFDACASRRLRELMQALVGHLHAFASEVELTSAEWEAAIRLLTWTGDITDDKRQEFILWSDTLGLSMLVDVLENSPVAGATESTVLGPFYVPGSPLRGYGESMAAKPAGVPAWIHGRVIDTEGRPLADAELDVWQNGDDQLYAVQTDGPEEHLRGRFRTREDGTFAFIGVRPVPYPIPDDGPVGAMLAATGRHPWRPAHIHMIVRAPGHRTVVTHIFDEGSDYLEGDTVFAVKPSLVRRFVEHRADDPRRPEGIDGAWVSMELELVLAQGQDDRQIADPGRTH